MSISSSGDTTKPGKPSVEQRGEVEWTDWAWKQFTANTNESKQLRANASLPEDSWNVMDDAVYNTIDDVLTVVQDLRGAGLTTPTSIYNKTIEWNVVDGSHTPSVDMDPETATEEGNVTYDIRGVPLPIVHDDYSIGFRDRPEDMPGDSLDTLNATVASRAVGETLENLTLNGWERTLNTPSDNYSLYGLTNHPDVNTGTLSDWTASTGNIRSDLRAMISVLKNDNNMRPGGQGYWVYLARDLEDRLNDIDDEGSGDMLARDRLESLSEIGRIGASDYLPAGSALMFRPTNDVVDLAIAEDFQTIEWEGPAGFRDHYKVMASMAPRVKSTRSGQCGIAFYS